VGYTEFSPERLLSLGFTAQEVVDGSWMARWDLDTSAAEELVTRTLAPTLDFHTSGTTGPSRTWRRYRDRIWLEAGMLAGFVAPERPAAVVSFVPPAHLYGALVTTLVPARLGIPVWYRSNFFGAMPKIDQGRVVVMATPWIFRLLLEHLDWVRGLEHITVMYGGAMLPATAGEFLEKAGPERALIVEVMGSTEAGGVATRRWREGEPPEWTLFPDVTFADEDPASGEEIPLLVRSPRLAFRPGEAAPPTWEADDRIVRLGERSFRLVGRRGRLVKVNGRRINLDEAEQAMRSVLDCVDLALRPITDDMIGEHLELLVVLESGTELSDVDLNPAFGQLGVRPKRVYSVPRIERSALGKLRHDQSSNAANVEVSAP